MTKEEAGCRARKVTPYMYGVADASAPLMREFRAREHDLQDLFALIDDRYKGLSVPEKEGEGYVKIVDFKLESRDGSQAKIRHSIEVWLDLLVKHLDKIKTNWDNEHAPCVQEVTQALKNALLHAEISEQSKVFPQDTQENQRYDLSNFNRPKEEVAESLGRLRDNAAFAVEKFDSVKMTKIELGCMRITKEKEVSLSKDEISVSKGILEVMEAGSRITDRYNQKAGDNTTAADGYVVLSVTLAFFEHGTPSPAGIVKISLYTLEGCRKYSVFVEPWLRQEGAELAPVQQAA